MPQSLNSWTGQAGGQPVSLLGHSTLATMVIRGQEGTALFPELTAALQRRACTAGGKAEFLRVSDACSRTQSHRGRFPGGIMATQPPRPVVPALCLHPMLRGLKPHNSQLALVFPFGMETKSVF